MASVPSHEYRWSSAAIAVARTVLSGRSWEAVHLSNRATTSLGISKIAGSAIHYIQREGLRKRDAFRLLEMTAGGSYRIKADLGI